MNGGSNGRMRQHRTGPAHARRLAAAAALAVPGSALASFGGSIGPITGWFAIVAAAVVSTPVALACVVIEWVAARHRPPLWAGFVALLLGLACLGRVLGAFGTMGDSLPYLMLIPPLFTLALDSLIPAPRLRLGVTWMIALGVPLLIVVRMPRPPGNLDEALSLFSGAVVTILLPWQLAFSLRQASLRRQGIAEPNPPDFRLIGRRLMRAILPAAPPAPPLPPLQSVEGDGAPVAAPRPPHTALRWWLAGAAGFHVAITLLTAAGVEMPAAMFAQAEYRIGELFRLPVSFGPDTPTRRWVLHGLPWSVLAGCVTWGWGACAGFFDAGKLAPLRLAAAVVPIALTALLLVTSRHGFL